MSKYNDSCLFNWIKYDSYEIITHKNPRTYVWCLYRNFRISEIEPKYYADGEDAYAMKRDLVIWSKQQEIEPADPDSFFKSSKDKSDHDKKKWCLK